MSGAGGPDAPAAFPWQEASAFCLGLLRWPPDVFWRGSPREIAAALDAFAPRGAAPERADLAALMARFPDAPSAQRDFPE